MSDDYDIDEKGQTTKVTRQQPDTLSPEVNKIKALTKAGYNVEEITPYHFRVNDLLDFYPTSKRYHDLVTQKRGGYQDALVVAQTLIAKA